MEPITFKINAAHSSMWVAWSKNKYDETGLQPILELIDNSFAANPTDIHMSVRFADGTASIEDNGTGLPTDADGLNRCFSYGMRNPTQLNEHGCGLKSSLAILDPSDSKWVVTWKRGGKIYQFKGPCYTSDNQTHSVSLIDEWPGKIDGPTGTLIEFPVTKDTFASLYSTKDAKKKEDGLMKRLKEEFSHYWMLLPSFESGHTSLFVNDQQVVPFKLTSVSLGEYTEGHAPQRVEVKLSTSASICVTYFRVKDKSGISAWFKNTYGSTGFYLFKNGRFIQKASDDKLYNILTGVMFHPSHSGFIGVINLHSKTQDYLPPTVTTKNRFDYNHPLFIEACELLKPVFNGKVCKPKEDSEEKKLDGFHTMRVDQFEGEDDHYKFSLKETMKYDDRVFSTPQLDGVEEFKDKVYVYEAKRHSYPCLQDIIQLYGNWVLSNQVLSEDKVKIPVLLIDSEGKFELDDKLKHTIKLLHDNCHLGFPLQIWNYKGAKLFK